LTKIKNIAILGSTGSIGEQALEVIKEHPELFQVEVLTANRSVDKLIEQAKAFVPNTVIIADEQYYDQLQSALSDLPIKVFAGAESIEDIVSMSSIDIVLTAMVGFSGLLPTVNAIKHKKTIALANKETLVVAGDIIQKLAMEHQVSIRPVDSEHSAIFQCLTGEMGNPTEKIYLTASGGPFRNWALEDFKNITLEQALKHPNWSMGSKITIDSATMMNKGLEAIEAKWLFDLKPDQIDVVVHPQSIVHSMVQFEDGSIKAQMGLPDMKLPIQYAFTYPDRAKNQFPRMNFMDYPNLEFHKPDFEKFKALKLAYKAMEAGGNLPCVMNAANEIAVQAFLDRKISFVDIANVVEEAMMTSNYTGQSSIEDYVAIDQQVRKETSGIILNTFS
jgi:1-deoxy-D-xylulose-5-phosphate reductoisomerase